MADDDLEVKFGADVEDVNRGVEEVKSKLHEVGDAAHEAGKEGESGFAGFVEALKAPIESIESMKATLAGFAELLLAAFAVEKIKEFVDETAEAAERIERQAEAFGVEVEAIQRLSAEAKLAGLNGDGVVRSLERLQMQLARGGPNSPLARALEAIGIHAKEFQRLDLPSQLAELSEGFSKYADGPEKLAAAMLMFRGNGEEMLHFLNQGKEKIAELGGEVEKTNVVMGKDMVEAFASVKEAENKLSEAMQGLEQDLAFRLVGAIKTAVEWLTTLAQSLDSVLKLAQSFGGFGTQIGMMEAGMSLGSNDALLTQAANIPTDAVNGRDVTVNAKKKPPFPQIPAAGGRGGGDDAAADEVKSAFDQAIEAAREGTQDVSQTLDSMVKHHEISWQDWATASKTALEQEAADVKAAADKALASAALTSEQKIEIKKRERQLQHQITREEVKDEEKAQDEIVAGWKHTFDGMFSAFNSAFQGMLTGQETFREAMRKLFQDIALHAAKAVENMIASGLSGLAAQKSMNLASITGSAGQAGAGAYGALAGIPIIGPIIAPIGAAAAFAGTMAFASADIGMWNVPSDQLALVHHNELIMPAAQAGTFRDMLSGGGGGGSSVHAPVSINIAAAGSREVNELFSRNGGALMKTIEKAVRDGHTSALRRLR